MVKAWMQLLKAESPLLCCTIITFICLKHLSASSAVSSVLAFCMIRMPRDLQR